MRPIRRVWITRAQPGADSTAARVRALGHEPLVAPLLAVRPLEAESLDLRGVAALAFGQMPPNGQVFQMPMSYPIGPVNVDLVTPRSIERIHATGRKVHVWTIDDPTTMHRLIDWGVDGIITDRPDSLKEVLRARGMWSTR